MFTVYCLLFTFYCLLFSCITFHSIKGRQKRESKLIGQCQKPFSDSSIVCLLFRHTLFTYLFLLSIHLKLMYLNVGGEHLCLIQISLFCDHNWSGPPNVKSCDDLAHYNGSGHNTASWLKICSTIKWKIPLLRLVCSFAFFSQPEIQLLQQWWSGGRFVGGYGRKWGSNCGFPLQRYHSSCFPRHLVCWMWYSPCSLFSKPHFSVSVKYIFPRF